MSHTCQSVLSYCSLFVLLSCPVLVLLLLLLFLSCGSILAAVGLPLVQLICSCPFVLHSSSSVLCVVPIHTGDFFQRSSTYLWCFLYTFTFLLFRLTSAETYCCFTCYPAHTSTEGRTINLAHERTDFTPSVLCSYSLSPVTVVIHSHI